MKRLLLLFFMTFGLAAAQSHGYVFFGPGGVTANGDTSGSLYAGVGGEVVFGPGFGGGAEVGYAAPWRQFGDGIGIGSANGSFHFHRFGRVVPFATGGYTLFFRGGHANGVNLGGGINWWFAERLGLRTEFRDQIGLGSLADVHFWAIRVGLSFR